MPAVDKQNDEVERAAYYENLKLPADLDYMQVSALSIEARQKLSKHKPETLGQTSRISGITPAAIFAADSPEKRAGSKGFAAQSDVVESGARQPDSFSAHALTHGWGTEVSLGGANGVPSWRQYGNGKAGPVGRRGGVIRPWCRRMGARREGECASQSGARCAQSPRTSGRAGGRRRSGRGHPGCVLCRPDPLSRAAAAIGCLYGHAWRIGTAPST